jgi:hypothetical protein
MGQVMEIQLEKKKKKSVMVKLGITKDVFQFSHFFLIFFDLCTSQ